MPTAQQTPDLTASALRYDTGRLANGIYTNDCMGFSVAIPSGWNLLKLPGDTETAVIGSHTPDGSIALLTINSHSDSPPGTGIVLMARDIKGFNGTAREYVTLAAQSLADKDPLRRKVLRSGYAVMYGGRQFYRSDYKQNLTNGGDLYLSYAFTIFRGHLLGGILSARSQAETEGAASALQHISFAPDQTEPACVEGDNSQTGRVMGVVGVVGGVPRNSGGPLRVRVSWKVAAGLLIKKVDPQYPEEARKAGVQGDVRLQIGVSKEGDVEPNITVVSGDSKLVPAALDAVKDWKFKPYLLNGQPAAIDTSVVITFDPLVAAQ